MDSDPFGNDTIGELVFLKSSPELRPISLLKIGGIYKVYLHHEGGGLTRTFNTETLPDEIKIKLTMLLSIDDHSLPALLDIGWASKLVDNSYCIMIDTQTYAGLRGEY